MSTEDSLSGWKISGDFIFSEARRAFLKNGLIFKNFTDGHSSGIMTNPGYYSHNALLKIGFGNAGDSYIVTLKFDRNVNNKAFNITRFAVTYSDFIFGRSSAFSSSTIKNAIRDLVEDFSEQYIDANRKLIKNPFE